MVTMTKTRVVLTFPAELTEKPLTYRLVRDFDLKINILRAQIKPGEEGKLVIEVENGSQEQVDAGLTFLEENGVHVELLRKEISWDHEECVACGACTAVCATGALSIDPETDELRFDERKCIVCELCVDACPLKIIKVSV